jgi:serine/threonine protein kinase
MNHADDHRQALSAAHVLDRYRIKRVLGAGGFGITYRANDTTLPRDDPARAVAIKEYLPFEIALRLPDGRTVGVIANEDEADYRFGLAKFEAEARTLAKFAHPGIVAVRRFFTANNTAYIVMPYERGIDLSTILNDPDWLTEDEILHLIAPILDALTHIHGAGFLHRDIKPGNIFIRRSDYRPLLLDFGAARMALGTRSRKLTTLLTPGYAPFEQYITDGNQGPWTDVYALGGVLYAATTKERPAEANMRIGAVANGRKDPYVPAARKGNRRFSRRLLDAIDAAMALREQDRPQTVGELRRLLGL